MDNKRDLMKYRIEQAKECLELAKTTVDISEKNSVNRSYYCIFHSMRAVLALDGFDSKKHSGIISYFRQNYIKTGKFDVNFSAIISSAFDVRGDSDYEDFYVVSKKQALQQIENAEMFLNAVEKYIEGLESKSCQD